mgnify:CR=1 FL=1
MFMENVMTFTKIVISHSACLRQYFYDFIFNCSIREIFSTKSGASGELRIAFRQFMCYTFLKIKALLEQF